jgi:hypothetical protein
MSKIHKTSKRKDLAFVTFSTHEEAKRAAENYKLQYGTYQGEYDQRRISPLGENVTVSLAFSQQAMQAKKKVKETRKTPVQNVPGHLNHHKSGVQIPGMGSYMSGMPKIPSGMNNIHGISNYPSQMTPTMMNMPTQIIPSSSNVMSMPSTLTSVLPSSNIPSQMSSSTSPPSLSNINNPNLNSTAMLAMMNIINMNKVFID